jgi:hypothetical protein
MPGKNPHGIPDGMPEKNPHGIPGKKSTYPSRYH